MNDLISRQHLIILLETEKEYRSNRGERGAEKGLCYALEIVDDMPSAPPERKTAKDIYNTAHGHCEFKCSACGVEIGVVEGGELEGGYFNFCPKCGARMEGGSDE